MHTYTLKETTLNFTLGMFAFLMSFNYILLGGLNVSILVFMYMILRLQNNFPIFAIGKGVHMLVFAVAFGTILSAMDVNTTVIDATKRALTVLPNYLYWCVLVLIMINLSSYIKWPAITPKIAIGLLLTLIFYTFRHTIVLPFLKDNSPNAYAFILVCFSAITVSYFTQTKGKIAGIIVLSLLLISLISIERRSGLALVGLSSLAAMFLEKVKIQYLTVPIIVGISITIMLQLSIVEDALYEASPRIHEAIYESDEITKTDQSYLTRRLMIERGMVSFAEHPLTGVGINNYAVNKIVNTDGNFEGADLVLVKTEDKVISAHNSYLLLLVEGGIMLLLPILMIFLYNLISFIRHYNRRTMVENSIYWSFIAMTLHLYVIAEIVNVYAWFIIGAATSLSYKYNTQAKVK